MTATITANKPLRLWRLLLPLGFQALLLLSIAIPPLYTEISGRTVVLKTIPIDPYDLLRGYSQTLTYEISLVENIKKLPGWETLPRRLDYNHSSLSIPNQTGFYLILEAPQGSSKIPQPWKPVQIQTSLPMNLPANRVALKGTVNYGRIEYGLETYYMPEELRKEVNNAVTESNRKQSGAVEIKVDANGRAVATQLWAGDRNYRF
ncbi:GDYXXLXY domain-containing protein [Pseudanabaena sp. PCC 6802]|uniref:GDYXXLXY domain-containing protein n=1 Tax=Pseudanabaena sp. PCC 6802 TaxID=118173 RepID=UPI00034A3D57|nr:GDYXXLXY domain-containing protein [Pseudanabaena sp. PCC 6802]